MVNSALRMLALLMCFNGTGIWGGETSSKCYYKDYPYINGYTYFNLYPYIQGYHDSPIHIFMVIPQFQNFPDCQSDTDSDTTSVVTSVSCFDPLPVRPLRFEPLPDLFGDASRFSSLPFCPTYHLFVAQPGYIRVAKGSQT